MLSKWSRFCDVGGLMWRIKAHASNGAGMRCVYLCHSSKPPTEMVAAANSHYRTFASIGTLKPKPPRLTIVYKRAFGPDDMWHIQPNSANPAGWCVESLKWDKEIWPPTLTSQKPFKGRLTAAIVKGSIATDCSLWLKMMKMKCVSSWGTGRQINNKFYLY